MCLRKFPGTVFQNIARFNIGNDKFNLNLISNHLSDKIDTPMYAKLKAWIQQFPNHSLFLEPELHNTPRRSIQPYPHINLTKHSTILSQPYMKFLLPQIKENKPTIDPTISLIGFHPTQKYHKSEIENNNKLIQNIYNNTSNKYNKYKSILPKD